MARKFHCFAPNGEEESSDGSGTSVPKTDFRENYCSI